jgi:cytochrome P450
MSQTAAKFAPGPNGLPLIGSIGTFRAKGTLDFWFDLWQEYGDVARAQMGPQILMQFVRPEHVQYILVKNKDNYVKCLSHDTLRIPLGTGILTAEGDLWRRQRQLMSPTYTPRAVTRFAGIMLDATDRMPAQVLIDKAGVVRFVHHGHSMSDIPKNEEILALGDEINARTDAGA